MVPTAATAVLAVPERPTAERPEPREATDAEGRFAGLMAQFVAPAPAPPPPPEGEKTGGPAGVEAAQTEAPARGPAAALDPAQAAAPSPQAASTAAGAAPADESPLEVVAPSQGPRLEPQPTPATAAKPQLPAALAPATALPAVPIEPAPAQAQAPAPAPGQASAPGVAPGATPGTTPAPEVKATLAPGPHVPPPSVAFAGVQAAEISADFAVSSGHIPPAPLASAVQVAEAPPPATSPRVVRAEAPAPVAAPPVPANPPTLMPSQAPVALSFPALPPTRTQPSPEARSLKPAEQGESGAKAEPLPEVPEPGTASERPETAAARAQAPAARAETTAAIPQPTLLQSPASFQGPAAPVTSLSLPVPAAPATAPAPQAPAGALAPPVTAPVAQVAGSLRWMLRGGAQEASLQLHPEALGQVTIHLKVEGGEVHARLWVTEPASVQAVQDGRHHLEQSLKEQGLLLGSFDLQQGRRPFQEAPPPPAYPQSALTPVAAARQEAPATPAATILNAHHVELYA